MLMAVTSASASRTTNSRSLNGFRKLAWIQPFLSVPTSSERRFLEPQQHVRFGQRPESVLADSRTCAFVVTIRAVKRRPESLFNFNLGSELD